jgi:CubicO group peptidase (beta-lactamase class C family)
MLAIRLPPLPCVIRIHSIPAVGRKGIPVSFAVRLLVYGMAGLPLLAPQHVSAGDRFAGMDPYIREAMQKWKVPGLAIAVVKDGETVLARGYGVSELGTDRKVTTCDPPEPGGARP